HSLSGCEPEVYAGGYPCCPGLAYADNCAHPVDRFLVQKISSAPEERKVASTIRSPKHFRFQTRQQNIKLTKPHCAKSFRITHGQHSCLFYDNASGAGPPAGFE